MGTGFIFAEAPFEDFVRENSPVLAAVFILLLAILVVRLVIKTMTRMILLSLLLLMVLFVYIERNEIRECTQTCSCTVAGVDVTLPACDPERL